MSSSLIGRTLGNYKVIEQLGQGGMATVYVAYQENVDRRVAIKVLPPHPGLDEQFMERFRLEAKTVARLQHPHILPLYDYGTDGNILYLVMPLADGGTLDDLVVDGPMQLQTIDRIIAQIAQALDYAHRQGVIHRDIKPANILLDGEGHALLADFGIVKITESGGNLTGTGIVGTPNYMAPEQAQGAPIDVRADIYSLGVVLHQMLTGKRPFEAASLMQIMLKVMQEPAPRLNESRPGLPPAIQEVLDHALEKDPDDRYQTATDMANDFTIAIHSQGEALQQLREQENIRPASRPLTQARVTPISDATDVLQKSQLGQQPTQALRETQAQVAPPPQTVIVHNNSNPLLLLGGFALIAVTLVVIVLIVTGTLGSNDSSDGNNNQIALNNTTEAEEQATPLVLPTGVPTFGRISFNSIASVGNSASIQLEGVTPPSAGENYFVWLYNTNTGALLNLGNIAVDPIGAGVLPYVDEDGTFLPAQYNAALVSTDGEVAEGELPENVVYSGLNPIEVSEMLSQLLFASINGLGGDPDAGELGGSLLAGAQTEADNGFTHSGLASSSTEISGLQTHAEHTINILLGEKVDRNGDGSGQNPGRGVGVIFFVNQIEELLTEATSAPTATGRLQSDAEFIRVCLDNTRERVARVVELESELLASDSFSAVIEQAREAKTVAEQIRIGFDLNENGQVEPFEGECGLDQIERFGILVGGIDLQEGGLPE